MTAAPFVSEDAAPVETEVDASGNTNTDACSVPAAADFSDEASDAEEDDAEDDGEPSPPAASDRLTRLGNLWKTRVIPAKMPL